MSSALPWLTAIAYPPTLSAWLAAIALIAFVLKRRRVAAGLLGVAVAWSLLWSLPAVSERLRDTLASRYPPAPPDAPLPPVDVIVVLGGGIGRPSWFDNGDAYAPVLANSRVAAGARAWQRGVAPRLLLSGGPTARDRNETRTMAQAMRRLGVPDAALLLDEHSRTTGDNARRTGALTAAHGWRRIVLVTSSMHMPRALELFRRQGLEVEPLAVGDNRLKGSPGWQPRLHTLRRSEQALKEYAGWALARLGLPAPG